MFINKVITAAALVALAAAVPLQQREKRDVTWETKMVVETKTVQVYTTVMLGPGETAPAAQGSGFARHSHGHGPALSQPAQSVPVAQPAGSAPVPSAAPAASSPTAAAPAGPPPSGSPASPPASPPASSPTAAPSEPPASSPSGGSPTSSAGGSAPSGQTYTGDITYYTPGLGSCGVTNTASDMILALAEDLMEAADATNPNKNPLCGKSITISSGGKTAVATIEDTCPGCSQDSLDLTPTLFEHFADLSVGRVSGVQWWYND